MKAIKTVALMLVAALALDVQALETLTFTTIDWTETDFLTGLTENTDHSLTKTATDNASSSKSNDWGSYSMPLVGDGEIKFTITNENKYVIGLSSERHLSAHTDGYYNGYWNAFDDMEICLERYSNYSSYLEGNANSANNLVNIGATAEGDVVTFKRLGSEVILLINGSEPSNAFRWTNVPDTIYLELSAQYNNSTIPSIESSFTAPSGTDGGTDSNGEENPESTAGMSVMTTADILAIENPREGGLIFSSDEQTIYQFDATKGEWNAVLDSRFKWDDIYEKLALYDYLDVESRRDENGDIVFHDRDKATCRYDWKTTLCVGEKLDAMEAVADVPVSIQNTDESAKALTIKSDDGTSTTENFVVYAGGQMWAKQIEVALENPYPDYVFRADYDLMTMDSLKVYIHENGHLPNVPSEQEVEAKGAMNLGEMNRVLLEKVEELTLYLLMQQEEIIQLKTQMSKIQ